MRKLFFKSMLLLCALIVGSSNLWGTETLYSTCLFGGTHGTSSGYTSTWTATNGDFSWSVKFGNTNGTGDNAWDYVKFGRKNNASVGEVTTTAAYTMAITKVTIAIDAITASKINSITLYTSSTGSNWTSAGTFTKATGNQSVELTSPTAGLYYKVEFNCASGSNNGLIQVSSIKYYYDYIAVSGVSLNTQSTSISVGGTETLTASITPSNASIKSVSWSSSNTNVAIVSSTGVVTAVATGEATITATTTDGSKTATCSVTVTAATPHTVTFADDESSLTETSAGAGITLPSRSGITGYSFLGWYTANVATTTTSLNVVSGTYYPLQDVTLYPVYSKSITGPVEETISTTIAAYATAHSWVNSTQYETVSLGEDVTATANGSANTGKYYTSGNDWRFYLSENADITIATSNGTLKSVILTYENTNSGTLMDGNSPVESGSSYSVSGTSKTFDVDGTSSAQVRITAISVSYVHTGTVTYYTSNPAKSIITTPDYFATFYSDENVSVPDGVTVYKGVRSGDDIVLKPYSTGIVPASTPVILKSNSTVGIFFDVISTDSEAGSVAPGENALWADDNAVVTDQENNTYYVLGLNGSNNATFLRYTGASIPAYRAYILVSGQSSAPLSFRITDEENNATNIENVEANENTVKFFENGQIYIKRGNAVYDALGRVIR